VNNIQSEKKEFLKELSLTSDLKLDRIKNFTYKEYKNYYNTLCKFIYFRYDILHIVILFLLFMLTKFGVRFYFDDKCYTEPLTLNYDKILYIIGFVISFLVFIFLPITFFDYQKFSLENILFINLLQIMFTFYLSSKLIIAEYFNSENAIKLWFI
jgi:hypothetical protein